MPVGRLARCRPLGGLATGLSISSSELITGRARQRSHVEDEWSVGFTADITVTGAGAGAIDGWTVTSLFPGGQRVTHTWNATLTRTPRPAPGTRRPVPTTQEPPS